MVDQQLDQRLSLVEQSGAGLGVTIVNLPGTGVPLFASQVGNLYNFKKIVGLGGVTITDAGTEVDISLAGALLVANNLSDVAAQQTALNNLTNVAGATNEFVLTKDTGSGNAIWKVATAGLTPPGNTNQVLRADGTWSAELKDAGAGGFYSLGTALVISDTGFAPGLWINQKGSNADSRLWRLTVDNSGGNARLGLYACNDLGAAPQSAFTITRAVGAPTLMTLMPAAGRVAAFAIADDGVTSFQIGGNMRFDGASRVISADTQNATLANRFVFQDSTLNANTSFNLVPNGTAVTSNTKIHNAASLTNAGFISTSISNTVALMNSGHNGAGTTLPLNLSIDGNASVQITAPGGRVLVGPGVLPTDDTTSALQVGGNFNFDGIGRRLRADFSNATPTNRTAFQSNVVNGVSSLGVIPNGTAQTANVRVFNNSDLTAAAAFCNFQVSNTFVVLDSNIINAGTQLPIALSIAGVAKLTVDVNGNTILANAQADKSYSLQVPTTGFTITIGNNISTLLLNPAGTLATGTITMPATPIDGQIVRLATTQTITALTVSPNAGQTISGNVTTLTAAAPATYMYNLSGTKWYHIQ
jgi:hypothetical protein